MPNRGYLFSRKLNKYQQDFISKISMCYSGHMYPSDRKSLTADELLAPFKYDSPEECPTTQEMGVALRTLEIDHKPYRGTNRWDLNQILNVILTVNRSEVVRSPPCPPHQHEQQNEMVNKASAGGSLIPTSKTTPVYDNNPSIPPYYSFIEPTGTDLSTNNDSWNKWYGSDTKEIDLLYSIIIFIRIIIVGRIMMVMGMATVVM